MSGRDARGLAGLTKLVDLGPGQRVGAVVLGVAAMAFHPGPVHAMRLGGSVEALPQLDVLDRLLVGGAPAVLLPAVYPPGGALEHVFAVGVELHHAGPLESLEARDRAHQLHLVVGRRRVAARQLLLALAHTKDGRPAAGARVAAAGAVGEQLDLGLALAHKAPFTGRSPTATSRCDGSAAWRDTRSGPCAAPGRRPACAPSRRAASA